MGTEETEGERENKRGEARTKKGRRREKERGVGGTRELREEGGREKEKGKMFSYHLQRRRPTLI